MTAPVAVTLNGEALVLDGPLTVADLLARVGAPLEGVAVEHNRAIVRRRELATTWIAPGDRIELVTLVGGG